MPRRQAEDWSWVPEALCSVDRSDAWYEVENARADGRHPSIRVVRYAKGVCMRCPVQTECLRASKGQVGIWGGLTAEERHVRRRRKRAG